MQLSACGTPDFHCAFQPLLLLPLGSFFHFFLKSLFFFLVSPVSVCICTQCVFTVTKAHFQTPTPVVTDTLRVPMAGLAFSHQVSPYWEEGDKSDGIFIFKIVNKVQGIAI